MFPGSVFLESDDEAALLNELGWYEEIADLRKESGAVLPVKKSEEMFLISLCGKNHHLGMSKGVIREGIMQVTEGPLRGREETIRRIDRHKRLARLAVPGGFTLGERTQLGTVALQYPGAGKILAGLEIVEKN